MLSLFFFMLLAAIAVFLAVVATQPDEFRVVRSATIAAPTAAIFPHVNILRQWEAWSPWARLDPHAKSVFEGPAEGVGAVMRWSGNYKVGQGSMTVTESTPYDLVRFRLDFLKPMKATNIAEFTFMPEGSHTQVTWSMHGKNNFIGKAFNLMFNCDKMVGRQFEQGLSNLKSIVEAQGGGNA